MGGEAVTAGLRGVVVFDRGLPTDVVDSSVLTCGTADPDRSPVELVPVDPGRAHPLATTAVGPRLAGLLEVFDPATLTDAGLVELVAAAERVKAWADARAVAATAELTARCARLRGVGPGRDEVPAEQVAAAELAAGLALSSQAARHRVELAQALGRLPRTRILLATGRIDLPRARAVVDAVASLDDATAAAVEDRVGDRAPTQTLPGLRAALRRAVIAADPAAAEARHQAARAERGVWRQPLEHGMARLEYVGAAPDVAALHTWITAKALAAGGPGDPRSLDQRRADVMADIGHHGLASEDLPRRHGRRPQIHVVVALSTLLGLDDQPGELTGMGPITAEAARRIAADGIWWRLLTDPVTGALAAMGTDHYQPPQDLRDAVLARDRTCQGPGCRAPAERCDLDHTVAWPCGPTCPANLHPLCRQHHRLKTLTDTRLQDDGHGGLVWTLPSGQRHHRPTSPVLDHPGLAPPAPPPDDDIPPF
jgi:hypothetical protein